MGKVNWVEKEYAYNIAEKFCNENGYSFEKLINLKFCKGSKFSFFAKFPDIPYQDDCIHLDSQETLPEVPIMVYADGTVKFNAEHLYLIS